MPTYSATQRQSVLCMLAYVSNFAEGTVVQLQATMAEKLSLIFALHEVQALIGHWEVVWGPVIFQAQDSDLADNTMFVASSLDEPQLVVSIAGTNPYSWFNWLFEDLPVRKQELWPTDKGQSPGLKPKISQGTANGLRILQAMQDDGATVVNFLQSYMMHNRIQPLPITVTGHSLGGALSPVMAVYLADMQPIWDPDGRTEVSVIPIAGPTPGNLDFSLYGDQVLNGRIQRLWNEKDIVPHAWDKSLMAKLSTLYAPTIKPTLLTRFVIALTRWTANRADYAHLQPEAAPLPGSVVPAVLADDLLPRSILNKLLPHYMVQMGYQHLEAYYDLLQMKEFSKLMGESLPEALAGPDLDELRRRVAEQSENKT